MSARTERPQSAAPQPDPRPAAPIAPSRAAPPARPRFLSEADCHEIAQRLARFSQGGGYTTVVIWSTWTGNVRWARNLISTAGEVRDNVVGVQRNLLGATGITWINDTTDAALVAAARRAERMAARRPERYQSDLVTRLPLEPTSTPQLFSETTYQLDAGRRAAAAVALAHGAADAGMLSAGYLEVSAHSMAILDTLGRAQFCQYTTARYSVTVRDPTGTGSGWAGVDEEDWGRIDGPALSAIALEKCLTSRHPVAVEPGRYTTILEPQAVCDFIGQLVYGEWGRNMGVAIDRKANEYRSTGGAGPFYKSERVSLLGERVMDERITISADPTDPMLGFPPFDVWGMGAPDPINDSINVYHPVTWIEHGVLTNLAYDRGYGFSLGRNTGLRNAGGFRMSGGETSLAEMIATTQRGLLVTRCDALVPLKFRSLLLEGYTRDGVWLIEHGKISKPVKNLVFTESILFALNNVEQLGVPQRVFHPPTRGWLHDNIPQPVIVPSMKIKDFSFTALEDAV